MKYLLVSAILLITCGKLNAISVDCTFRHDNLGYCCQVITIQITSRDDRNVTAVTGTHQGGMSNDRVSFFQSHDKTVNFMPRNLEQFFPNIEVIQIFSANLVEVTMDDFKPFGEKLKKIWFNKNEIAVVDADLFKYNPNLNFVAFYHTKVRHVENGAFDHLTRLTTLYFENNKCLNENAIDNRLGVLTLINRIETHCKDAYFEQRGSQNKRVVHETVDSNWKIQLADEIKEQILTPLTAEIKKINQQIAALTTKISSTNEISQGAICDDLIHKLDDTCSSLKTDFLQVSDKVEDINKKINCRRP